MREKPGGCSVRAFMLLVAIFIIVAISDLVLPSYESMTLERESEQAIISYIVENHRPMSLGILEVTDQWKVQEVKKKGNLLRELAKRGKEEPPISENDYKIMIRYLPSSSSEQTDAKTKAVKMKLTLDRSDPKRPIVRE